MKGYTLKRFCCAATTIGCGFSLLLLPLIFCCGLFVLTCFVAALLLLEGVLPFCFSARVCDSAACGGLCFFLVVEESGESLLLRRLGRFLYSRLYHRYHH
jgi:hypothetical protein